MEEEKENVMSGQLDFKKLFTFLGIIAVTAIVWNLPIDTFGDPRQGGEYKNGDDSLLNDGQSIDAKGVNG